MKSLTNTLIPPALNWAVAICQNVELDETEHGIWFDDHNTLVQYAPSQDWSQGGPIIFREKIDFKWIEEERCRAAIEWLDEPHYEAFGPTPLIAAMRCYVASKLGDEIDIPKELL